MKKTYSELIKIDSYEDRVKYLSTNNKVGDLRFGHARYLNQGFYKSLEWRRIRDKVLIRDNGCDLALPDRKIFSNPHIHHIVPITIEDIENRNDLVFNLNNLITVSQYTHNLIHYGKIENRIPYVLERKHNDTTLWRYDE